MKKVIFILGFLLWIMNGAYAQTDELPANFPSITTEIYDSNAIGKGYIFLAVAADAEGVGHYLMILDNDGTPVWYKEDEYSYDFKVQPNGLLTYARFLQHHSYAGGGDVVHIVMDQDYNEVENIQMGNGYIAEAHDFQLLPNGHVLLFGYYLTQVDLSKQVLGGYPNALVSGGIVQELDDDRNVIFQWRTWDQYSLEDYEWGSGSSSPIISEFHLNTINMDIDGNIIIATPVWVKKINRQTGEIIWHLGGDENEFTVVGIDPEEANGHFGGHAFHRIPNGNFLVFDNGTRNGRRSSQVHEYKLDEENKIAEHVWTYVPDTTIPSWHRGSAQRLPNGNTFIGWGGASGKPIPACTEVTRDGKKVFELFFDNPVVESYRAFRFPLPSDVPGIQLSKFLVSAGDHDFVYGDIDTGVSIKIRSLTGSGYNTLAVLRRPFAPINPEFAETAPTILPVYVLVGGHNIYSIDGQISFDVESFKLRDPENLTIYYRESAVQGVFTPLETSYNWATNKLRADMTGYGEFVIGKPDLEHVALAPILIAPEPDGTVNEALPIAFEWTPRGFVNNYHLQVATDREFNELVVDELEIKETPYILETVEAGTIYYWQVSTINDAGPSEWSQASFTTVPPIIRVTAPNGGEQWRRGIEYFIQWDDNLAEDVVIELYKGEALLQTIDTVPSTGAYKWEASLTLEPGDDYSIQIKSTVDEIMADMSDAVFTIK